MYIFKMKKGTFAFPEDPDGTYKAALFAKAHGIVSIFIERDPPKKDNLCEYMKYAKKVDGDARVAAKKIMTTKEAWYKHLNYDLIIESAAMEILEKTVDLEKYRVKNE